MTHYTLVDPFTGFSKTVPKTELLQDLMLNCILLQDEEHLGIITHRDLVAFTRWCANVMRNRMIDIPTPDSLRAMQLVDQWLENSNSLSYEQLDFIAGYAIFDDNSTWTSDYIIDSPVRIIANVNWALNIITNLAWSLDYHAIITYEAQEQWFVEHIRSGK